MAKEERYIGNDQSYVAMGGPQNLGRWEMGPSARTTYCQGRVPSLVRQGGFGIQIAELYLFVVCGGEGEGGKGGTGGGGADK